MGVAIGIEIGGTQLRVGVGRQDGQLLSLAHERVDRRSGAAGIRQALPGLVRRALAEADVPEEDLVAVGVGFRGPVQAHRGVTVLSEQVAGWADFPLGRWLEGQFHATVVVQNDANAAGYAEAMIGAGRGHSRVLYITIGSGIGGGWIVDGVIDNGQGVGAAEIGHTWVPYPGTRALAELQRVASGWAIGRRARAALESGEASSMCQMAEGNLARISAVEVYAAAEEGDPLAQRILAETCDALAMSIGNAVNLYHPHRVVIGGGVSRMGELFWSAVREQTHRYVYEPFMDGGEIVPGALGEPVVVIGAVLLAWQAAEANAAA